LVEFDWTSEVDDIAGGDSGDLFLEYMCVLLGECGFDGDDPAVLWGLVWLVVAVRTITAQHFIVA